MFELKQFVSTPICLDCNGCCSFREQESIWQPTYLSIETEGTGTLKTVPFEEHFICSKFKPEEGTCQIYSKRPLECMLYPFLINRLGNQLHLALDLNCPFAQKKYKSEEFNNYFNYLLEFIRQPDLSAAIQENYEIFNNYSSHSQGNIRNLITI